MTTTSSSRPALSPALYSAAITLLLSARRLSPRRTRPAATHPQAADPRCGRTPATWPVRLRAAGAGDRTGQSEVRCLPTEATAIPGSSCSAAPGTTEKGPWP